MASTSTTSNEKIANAKPVIAATKKPVIAAITCQCCKETPLRDTFGEWYEDKWWCYNHVENLFKSQNVNNLSGLWKKSGVDSW